MGKIFLMISLAASSAFGEGRFPFQPMTGLLTAWSGPSLSQKIPTDRVLKVAVLDKGFEGVEKEIGRSLPAGTRVIAGPIVTPKEASTDHGLRMAQLLSLIATDEMSRPGRIELRLYNVFGFTNFSSAIDDLVKWKADLVLYSEVWEFGGNHDGRGFINAEVRRATDRGILWVNAAGNFARGTYNTPIETLDQGWVRLPDQNKSLAVRCEAPSGKTCQLKAVLSWNDFKDDVNLGTDKDLDLALTDDMLDILQTSTLRQSKDPKEERPGFSKYPRETVAAELKTGTYYLRVKNVSGNFQGGDRLRITVDGLGVSIPSTAPDESVLNPADAPGVLTVGAIDSERSSRSPRLSKPEVWAPSSVFLEDGNEFRGSSNSAALVAGYLVLIKLRAPSFGKDKAQLQGVSWNWNAGATSLRMLGFGPSAGSCFVEQSWAQAPGYVREALSLGGRLVVTTAGWRIMMPYDPAVLGGGLARQRPDDMIVMTPERGLAVYPRYSMIPQGSVELFQRPIEAGLCRPPDADRGTLFIPR